MLHILMNVTDAVHTKVTVTNFQLFNFEPQGITSGMILTIFSILLLIAGIFQALKWSLFSRMICAIALSLFFAIGSGIAPKILLDRLQSPYVNQTNFNWQHQNAIVMLGAGTAHGANAKAVEVGIFGYGRLAKTLALYRDCKKSGNQCTVIVSGGDAHYQGTAEATVYAAYLQNLGIESADLVLESKSLNTWQNAQFTAAILRAQTHDSVLLVTSGVHLTRSLLYFQQAGVTATPVRADYLSAVSSWVPISYNFLVTDLALHENLGVLRYRLYNRLGWNSSVTKPGSL